MMEKNYTHNNLYNDKALVDNRRWLDRVNGVRVKKRMWREQPPHPFPEIRDLVLDPLPPIWVIGAKPRKKKRGRKFKRNKS